MATSLTSPGLILGSSKALMETQRAIALAKLFTTDFSSELQDEGKTLKVPVFSGDATVYNETSNDFETTDGSIIPATIILDTLVKVTYKLGMTDLLEVDKSATSRNCGIAGGRAIARKIEELIVGKLGYANAVAQATGFTVAKLGKAIATAEKNDIDPATIVAILAPDAYGDLLDANTANAAITGDNIAEALGRKYGIKAIVSSAKVANASAESATKGVGFLVPDAAIAIAGRGIEQAVDGMYAEYGTTTDDDSGLTITSFVHGQPGKNARFMNVAALLGSTLTRTSNNKAPGFVQLVTA